MRGGQLIDELIAPDSGPFSKQTGDQQLKVLQMCYNFVGFFLLHIVR